MFSVDGGGVFPLFPETRPEQPTKPKLAIAKANKKMAERWCKTLPPDFRFSPQALCVFEREGRSWPESST
jgi:hypothetical protein